MKYIQLFASLLLSLTIFNHSFAAHPGEYQVFNITDCQTTDIDEHNHTIAVTKTFYKVKIPVYASRTKLALPEKQERFVSLQDREKIKAIVNGQITSETKFPVGKQIYDYGGFPLQRLDDLPPTIRIEWKTAQEKALIERQAWYASLSQSQKIGSWFGLVRKDR